MRSQKLLQTISDRFISRIDVIGQATMIESINFKLWIRVEVARKKKHTYAHVLGLTQFKYVQGF